MDKDKVTLHRDGTITYFSQQFQQRLYAQPGVPAWELDEMTPENKAKCVQHMMEHE
tara:strand:+ start:1038 stop:1205 length:168 start_codon:yes stop_codon:yes gene_type:complete